MEKIILIFLISLVLVASITTSVVNAEITGQETMTRTVPSSATLGSTFSITYTVQGASGLWGATIVDSVSGGCEFLNGKNTVNDVMISDAGDTRIIMVNAPSSAGECTFTGDYKFGNFPIENFDTQTITITGSVTQRCGNDIKEGTEQCDGDDLGQADCISLRYFGGSLSCTSSCRYDASNCTGKEAVCGNSLCESGESCSTCSEDCGSCEKINATIIILIVVVLIVIVAIILILILVRKGKKKTS